MEIDYDTVHKVECARISLGCKDASKVLYVAKGVLGEDFYDFFYEVEYVVLVLAKMDRFDTYYRINDSSLGKGARTDAGS